MDKEIQRDFWTLYTEINRRDPFCTQRSHEMKFCTSLTDLRRRTSNFDASFRTCVRPFTFQSLKYEQNNMQLLTRLNIIGSWFGYSGMILIVRNKVKCQRDATRSFY